MLINTGRDEVGRTSKRKGAAHAKLDLANQPPTPTFDGRDLPAVYSTKRVPSTVCYHINKPLVASMARLEPPRCAQKTSPSTSPSTRPSTSPFIHTNRVGVEYLSRYVEEIICQEMQTDRHIHHYVCVK